MLRQNAALALLFAAAGAMAAGVPSPESYFGHRMGADRKLLDWDKVVSYFQALEKSSDRIHVRELGKTVAGRPFIAAAIGAPETIRNLNRYQVIQSKLADPRQTAEEEAQRLFGQGKTVVLITCSVHSTEVASTHSAVELAWRLLTEDKPKFQTILQNTILLLVPSLNPDGVDIVTQWYRKTLGTPYEGTAPPELYHKYVGHDNNRDWYMFSQPETRATISQLHNVWHPQIVYDVHQQGPNASRMFVPPWLDPVDPNIDAIIAQLCNAVGAGMAADLTAAGKTGVLINALYDFWTPARHYQAYHGGLRILSESASAKLATPIVVKPAEIGAGNRSLGYDPKHRSWNYLEPWEGGEWHLRDIVDYQLIAMESCLYQAAIRREDMLRSFYAIGKRALARKTPYAFIVPVPQFDPGSARKMLETLSYGMVEIEQASEAFQAADRQYNAGSYVVRMHQPYSSYAKTLLERQSYPDLRLYPGGPPKRPYDVTAQTLPLLMGVRVDTIEKPFTASLKLVTSYPVKAMQSPAASGVLPASDINSWKKVNQIWKSGKDLWRDRNTGDFYSRNDPGIGRGNLMSLKRPRVGLYKSYVPSMDEGWTRWLLEQFGFEFNSVSNRDIQSGKLAERYDTIVIPDQPPASIMEGFRPGSMPEEYVGGLGDKGAEALKQFARQGGTLVLLNHSTDVALGHLDVKAKNVISGVSNREFYSPGSLLNVVLETHHPLTLGLPSDVTLWSEGSPAWDVPEGGQDIVVARYPRSQILASGWLLGEKYLAGRAALLDVPVEKGHIILFGMRPQYRAQSYQNFKLFFNSLVLPRS